MVFEEVERTPDWHKEANCNRHPNPELWWYEYPHNSDTDARQEVIYQVASALEYCYDCPVKKQCLEEGLKQDNLHPGSIWGGLLFNDRRKIANKKRCSGSYGEEWIKAGLARRTKTRYRG